MTAIAGLIDNGKVWLGGDSAGVASYSLQIRSDPKVFKIGEFVFGYTTSFRMGQIIKYHFNPPKPLENQNNMEYMVLRFIPDIKEAFKKNGFQRSDKGEDSGGTFLVGYRRQLYVIESDYQVGRNRLPYHACGCGQDMILGSLYTSEKHKIKSPKTRIITALESAEQFSAGVRKPFTIVHT